jgi:recombinational DNA repair ATPase RecF
MNLDLIIHNWRCFGEKSFSLPSESFVISDENGKGKTSLLSAIYSLYTGQPWVGTRFSESLKQNANYFGVLTAYPNWSLSGQISPSGRLTTKYSKPESFSYPYHHSHPAVFTYTPQDNQLLSLARSTKLAHFDEIIGQIYPEFTVNRRKLDKQVKAKTSYIKHCFDQEVLGEEAMIISLTEEINWLSIQMWKVRHSFFDSLQNHLPEFETWIQSPLRSWSIKHTISFIDGRTYPFSADLVRNLSHPEIMNLWQKERIIGKVMYGSQRDDVMIVSGHTQSEISLSRGEMRLLVLFLKSSAQKILFELHPEKPVFWLLDDVFNEFDDKREDIVFQEILKPTQFSIITSTRNLHVDLPKFSLAELEK